MRHLNEFRINITKIATVDYTKDKQTGQLNLTAPTKASESAGLRNVLSIAVGARVMLIVNIDITYGLVNGACGQIFSICSTDSSVDTLLVQFDNKHVGLKSGS